MYLVACHQALYWGESREVTREQHAKCDAASAAALPLARAFSRGSLHSLAINGEVAGRLCISLKFNEIIMRECPGLVFLNTVNSF